MSASLFSLDHMVAFTHVVESLLDAVRDGRAVIDDDMVALLLACCDHLSSMTDGLAAGQYEADPDTAPEGERLLLQLRRRMGTGDEPAQSLAEQSLTVRPEPDVERMGQEASDGDSDYWHCLLYTSPSPRDGLLSRMPSSA